jgi:HlyD family secretion protein
VRKQFIAAPVVILTLSGLLVWRVRANKAHEHDPSSGSATVEGIETVVSAKMGGRLVEVLVNEGDTVKKGQVVAKLDCSEQEAFVVAAKTRVHAGEAQVAVAEAGVRSAQASAAVMRAQVNVALAQTKVLTVEQGLSARDKSRAETLGSSGVISAAELDKAAGREQTLEEQRRVATANVATAQMSSGAAATTILTAKAQLEAAQAAVETAVAEKLRAELAVRECTLTAHRDGIVTSRLYEPGAVIGPGARILTVLDTSTAKATFFLPNAELGRARIDGPAEVRVDAFPGRVFTGQIHRIAAEAEFTPRNVQTREDRDRLVYAVEVHVDNADGTLRAGMPAEVVLMGTQR